MTTWLWTHQVSSLEHRTLGTQERVALQAVSSAAHHAQLCCKHQQLWRFPLLSWANSTLRPLQRACSNKNHPIPGLLQAEHHPAPSIHLSCSPFLTSTCSLPSLWHPSPFPLLFIFLQPLPFSSVCTPVMCWFGGPGTSSPRDISGAHSHYMGLLAALPY